MASFSFNEPNHTMYRIKRFYCWLAQWLLYEITNDSWFLCPYTHTHTNTCILIVIHVIRNRTIHSMNICVWLVLWTDRMSIIVWFNGMLIAITMQQQQLSTSLVWRKLRGFSKLRNISTGCKNIRNYEMRWCIFTISPAVLLTS